MWRNYLTVGIRVLRRDPLFTAINLAGHPAMSVPFGAGADGMPVGVQLLAPALGEAAMFRAAAALEAAAPPLEEAFS